MAPALVNHQMIDELLSLAGVSSANAAARSWIHQALAAAQHFAVRERLPAPVEHNAPLKRVERAVDQLLAELGDLRRHGQANEAFWRLLVSAAAHASKDQKPDFIPALKRIRHAARSAQVKRTGRPRNVRKQHIVDFAFAFCVRFSPREPSSDPNNFFPAFAERFFEHATELSVEDKSNGIDRQIRLALRQRPIEKERARLLNETRQA